MFIEWPEDNVSEVYLSVDIDRLEQETQNRQLTYIELLSQMAVRDHKKLFNEYTGQQNRLYPLYNLVLEEQRLDLIQSIQRCTYFYHWLPRFWIDKATSWIKRTKHTNELRIYKEIFLCILPTVQLLDREVIISSVYEAITESQSPSFLLEVTSVLRELDPKERNYYTLSLYTQIDTSGVYPEWMIADSRVRKEYLVYIDTTLRTESMHHCFEKKNREKEAGYLLTEIILEEIKEVPKSVVQYVIRPYICYE